MDKKTERALKGLCASLSEIAIEVSAQRMAMVRLLKERGALQDGDEVLVERYANEAKKLLTGETHV